MITAPFYCFARRNSWSFPWLSQNSRQRAEETPRAERRGAGVGAVLVEAFSGAVYRPYHPPGALRSANPECAPRPCRQTWPSPAGPFGIADLYSFQLGNE